MEAYMQAMCRWEPSSSSSTLQQERQAVIRKLRMLETSLSMHSGLFGNAHRLPIAYKAATQGNPACRKHWAPIHTLAPLHLGLLLCLRVDFIAGYAATVSLGRRIYKSAGFISQ